MEQKLVQRCDTKGVADACNASYTINPMSWQANTHSGFIEEVYVKWVQLYCCGVERAMEAFCVLWICDQMSKILSLKVT